MKKHNYYNIYSNKLHTYIGLFFLALCGGMFYYGYTKLPVNCDCDLNGTMFAALIIGFTLGMIVLFTSLENLERGKNSSRNWTFQKNIFMWLHLWPRPRRFKAKTDYWGERQYTMKFFPRHPDEL